jgi:hypothetical protein
MSEEAIVNCVVLEVLGSKPAPAEPNIIVNCIVLEVLGKVE